MFLKKIVIFYFKNFSPLFFDTLIRCIIYRNSNFWQVFRYYRQEKNGSSNIFYCIIIFNIVCISFLDGCIGINSLYFIFDIDFYNSFSRCKQCPLHCFRNISILNEKLSTSNIFFFWIRNRRCHCTSFVWGSYR